MKHATFTKRKVGLKRERERERNSEKELEIGKMDLRF